MKCNSKYDRIIIKWNRRENDEGRKKKPSEDGNRCLRALSALSRQNGI